jgi:hypothetical protein
VQEAVIATCTVKVEVAVADSDGLIHGRKNKPASAVLRPIRKTHDSADIETLSWPDEAI